MSIYSNDNIRKIAKLTTRELPQNSKNAKITVRENNGLYSSAIVHDKIKYETNQRGITGESEETVVVFETRCYQ